MTCSPETTTVAEFLSLKDCQKCNRTRVVNCTVWWKQGVWHAAAQQVNTTTSLLFPIDDNSCKFMSHKQNNVPFCFVQKKIFNSINVLANNRIGGIYFILSYCLSHIATLKASMMCLYWSCDGGVTWRSFTTTGGLRRINLAVQSSVNTAPSAHV